jgi:hypothetical protein
MIDLKLIEKFDKHLQKQLNDYKASIIGGTAIQLLSNDTRVTGDIDSFTKIPPWMKKEIKDFANQEGIDTNWFNDNVSRNYNDFMIKGEEIFDKLLYEGKRLSLYAPSMVVLLLSKIYGIVDRTQGSDFDDIKSVMESNTATKEDLKEALSEFKSRIRFEEGASAKKRSHAVAKIIENYLNTQVSQGKVISALKNIVKTKQE